MERARGNNIRSGGFTLLEILFAVVTVSLAFVTLVGLQSAAVSGTVRIGNRQEAMLVLRRILSFIELNEDVIEPQQRSGSITDVMKAVSDGKPFQIDPALEKKYTATLAIEEWRIPLVESENPLLRVQVTVSWGARPEDAVSIPYFLARQAPDETGEES